MFTSRKGSLKSLFIVFTIVLMMFLSLLFGHTILSKIQDQSLLPNSVLNNFLGTFSLMDAGVVFLLFAFVSIIMLRAFQTSVHPVYVVPGILFIGVMIVALSWFSNLFWRIVNFSAFTESANSFPFGVLIIQNLPIIGGIAGGVVLIVMIGRWR